MKFLPLSIKSIFVILPVCPTKLTKKLKEKLKTMKNLFKIKRIKKKKPACNPSDILHILICISIPAVTQTSLLGKILTHVTSPTCPLNPLY